jgi:glutaminyl-tRNA synthetase
MPTISGLRRRGYTPASIRDFCDRIGVAKANSRVEIELLEHCIREELNKTALRKFVILDPLKVVVTTYPKDKVEKFDVVNNPEDEEAGSRALPFTREIYIEREDFMEDPPKKFFRLSPGKEVRLKHSYYITCDEVVKDDDGNVVELRCSHDPDSKGGWNPDGHKVSGTLHWVSAKDAVSIQVRQYDRLFKKENPDEIGEGSDFTDNLNENSLKINDKAVGESSIKDVEPGQRIQFFRQGYYTPDLRLHSPEKPVYNRIVPLKDTWAKIARKS